ncbi:MAG: bifunctional adenosylcobinamide kinase/adenosylcobinamide-phosphate guanylyltransferase, partial [Pseudomonadota bacterium]
MLILGGARSGKSRRALVRAETCDTHPVYIATAEP